MKKAFHPSAGAGFLYSNSTIFRDPKGKDFHGNQPESENSFKKRSIYKHHQHDSCCT